MHTRAVHANRGYPARPASVNASVADLKRSPPPDGRDPTPDRRDRFGHAPNNGRDLEFRVPMPEPTPSPINRRPARPMPHELGGRPLNQLAYAFAGIAVEAAVVVMAIYDKGARVRIKPDASPVCDADERAEAIIGAGLSALMPDVDIGRHARLRRVVIDRGVHIPEGLVVGEDPDEDARRFRRTDSGIVLITQPMLDQLVSLIDWFMSQTMTLLPTNKDLLQKFQRQKSELEDEHPASTDRKVNYE